MSKGAGAIERKIAELFAATRDRGLTVAELATHAFELSGRPATRAQRLSATRAGHRVLRRMKETRERARLAINAAHREAKASVGDRPTPPEYPRTVAGMRDYDASRAAYEAASEAYNAALEATESYHRGMKLYAWVEQFGSWSRTLPAGPGRNRFEEEYWRATIDKRGTLYFHPPDAPVRVWAVSIERAGAIWVEAKVEKITDRNVVIRYAGEIARLDREKLWRSWAWWRGVCFVSSRSGDAARRLDELWQASFGDAAGGVPPAMQMALAEAMALLGVPENFTKENVLIAFRREAKKAHPDVGGTAEMFDRLVKARDRLLASLGTTAPAPQPPQYTPKGVRVSYGSIRTRGTGQLGFARRLSAK
jgi:hypothetical protein